MSRNTLRVIVATTSNPFVRGGSTYICESLGEAVRRAGHECETITLPFSDSPDTVLQESLAVRLLDLRAYGDRLITIRTPAHLLRHDNKVCWFIHHYRSAYDLWGTRYQTLPNTEAGEACRRAIVSADSAGLGEARKVFCNSRVVQARLRQFNGVDAPVLYPPLLDSERFHPNTYGDFVLYISRLTYHKRQWLAVEAMRHTRTRVRLIIAGATDPDCEPYVADLRLLVSRYQLEDRVIIGDEWIGEDTKAALVNDCLALLYFPHDEDSYGYPSLEAHAASKAVITTTDAGGTKELIEHERNGLVVPPDPELLAAALDRLYLDRAEATRLGQNGPVRVRELGIGWEAVLNGLLG